MKTRKFDWFDTNTGTPVFSFQVHKDGKWMNVSNGNKPAFYKTEAERDQARKDFNKPKKHAVSDETLDKIIDALDDYARRIDPHEYGLPAYSDVCLETMRGIILRVLETK
jgi:hypothetical protein